jgi:uncharacterized membrane protein
MTIAFGIHKHRMEALVDGVFAIAMTILVLEVKVPELANPSDGGALLHALAHHLYVIVAYFLSFAMLGLFWVWHHRLAHKVRDIDGALMTCTLAFLSLICFFPFAAALFGRYVAYTQVVVLVYLPVVGLILMSQTLYFWLAIDRGLILADMPASEVRSAHRYNLWACAVFCLGAAPACMMLGNNAAGFGATGAVALMGAVLAWRAVKA